MCFSATASFVASAGLGIIGLLSLARVRNKSYLMFASIPLLFALQQASEGILWLYEGKSVCMIHTFLFFALLVWPTWIPCALLMIEKNHLKEKILLYIAGIGTTISAYWGYILATTGASAAISDNHIVYTSHFPYIEAFNFGIILYGIATIAPFFISSHTPVRLFGILALASCGLAYIAWYDYFTSVWCFFAAILSASIIYLLGKIQK